MPSSEMVSRQMSRMPTASTGPELNVRRLLHRRGLRFRVHIKRLPGTPDIVFSKARLAIFVDGCFWHGCVLHGTLPKNNQVWWQHKLAGNAERDRRKDCDLVALGWTPLHFWEHDARGRDRRGDHAVVASTNRPRMRVPRSGHSKVLSWSCSTIERGGLVGHDQRRAVDVTPSARRLTGSLRDIGYDFVAALADLVDNSVAAGASEVEIEIVFDGPASFVLIADNGSGMTETELNEALRFGTRRDYELGELGRYGLGLKTASISQGRRVTVSRRSVRVPTCGCQISGYRSYLAD